VAALIARVNQLSGKPAGFLNPQLYQNSKTCAILRQATTATLAAAAGWDACTGLGSPNGAALRSVI